MRPRALRSAPEPSWGFPARQSWRLTTAAPEAHSHLEPSGSQSAVPSTSRRVVPRDRSVPQRVLSSHTSPEPLPARGSPLLSTPTSALGGASRSDLAVPGPSGPSKPAGHLRTRPRPGQPWGFSVVGRHTRTQGSHSAGSGPVERPSPPGCAASAPWPPPSPSCGRSVVAGLPTTQ